MASAGRTVLASELRLEPDAGEFVETLDSVPETADRPPSRLLWFLGVAFRRSIAIVVLLAIWEVAPRVGIVDQTFLPPFSHVMQAWWGLLRDGQLGMDTKASLVRAAWGFGLAVLIAVPLGLLIAWYRPINEYLNPLLEVFRNTAVLALLPVFILTLGIGQTSKVAIVLYACTWPILLNTISGVREVDPLLIKAARSMNVSSLRLFQKVVLPAAVPTMFTGIRLAGTHAILVLIAAELIGANSGLGYLVNYSENNFHIEDMYAAIISISVLGLILNRLLIAVERYFSRWRPASHS